MMIQAPQKTPLQHPGHPRTPTIKMSLLRVGSQKEIIFTKSQNVHRKRRGELGGKCALIINQETTGHAPSHREASN